MQHIQEFTVHVNMQRGDKTMAPIAVPDPLMYSRSSTTNQAHFSLCLLRGAIKHTLESRQQHVQKALKHKWRVSAALKTASCKYMHAMLYMRRNTHDKYILHVSMRIT
jgi:hypothetical protein